MKQALNRHDDSQKTEPEYVEESKHLDEVESLIDIVIKRQNVEAR